MSLHSECPPLLTAGWHFAQLTQCAGPWMAAIAWILTPILQGRELLAVRPSEMQADGLRECCCAGTRPPWHRAGRGAAPGTGISSPAVSIAGALEVKIHFLNPFLFPLLLSHGSGNVF